MLFRSRDKGPLLEICLLEGGGSGIYGAAVVGGERFCMSSMDECRTASHTQSRGLIYTMRGGKGGVWVVLSSSALRLPLSNLYQPVLSGETDSNIKNFEGLPLSY